MSEDAFTLPKLSWQDWQAKYVPKIRVGVVWEKLQDPEPSVYRTWIFAELNSPWKIIFPWYDGGNWRDGVPKRLSHDRTSDSIVVAPAVYLGPKKMFLLDGCHRVSCLRPRLLILDVILMKDEKQLVYFTDLLRTLPPRKEENGKRKRG